MRKLALRRRRAVIGAAAAMLLPRCAAAADFSWTFDGGGTSWTNTWSVASNWVPNSVPNASSTDVTFLASGVLGGAGTIIVNSTLSEGTLHFNSSGADGYILSGTGGGTLTFPANGTIDVSASSVATIANGLQLRATSGLTKIGGGTLVISSNGTYTGTTTIAAGTLAVTGAATLGTGTIILNGGALAQVGAVSASISAPIVVQPAGGTISFQTSGNPLLNSALSGSGTVFWAKNVNLATANGSWQDFAGTLDFGQSSGTFRLNNTQNVNYGAPNAFWNLGNGGVTLTTRQGNVTGAGFNIGALTGGPNATFTGANNGTGNTTTWIVGGLNLSTTFAGSFSDADAAARTSGITKTGTGTLTLTGTSYSSGDVTVNQGRLIIAGAGDLAGNPFASLNQNIIINGGTFGLSGTGTIEGRKTIFVNNGVFDVSGVSSGFQTPGSVTLVGATGPATGYVRGGYAHLAGTISPGGDEIAGSVTFGSAANPATVVLGGGNIILEANSAGTLGAGINDLITVNGTLDIQPGTSFRLYSVDDDHDILMSPGAHYPILRYTGTRTGTLNVNITSPYRGFFFLSDHPGAGGGTLTIDQATYFFIPPPTITWTGAASNDWDLNITSNFSEYGQPASFYQFDHVVFGDTAPVFSDGVVNLPSRTAKPGSVLINNNTKPYTFTGQGRIGGSGGLIKTGTGQLTILNRNFYTGGSTISGGLVKLGADIGNSTFSFLGSGTVWLANATLSLSSNIIANDLVVPAGASSTLIFNNMGNIGSGNWVGAIRGGGTINLLSNGNNNGNGSVNLTGDNRDATGWINLLPDPAFANGTILVRIAAQNATGNMTWNVPSRATLSSTFLDPWISEIPLAALVGDGTLNAQFNGTNRFKKRWLIGGAGTDSSFAGAIVETPTATQPTAASGVIKTGGGSLILSGTSTYTAETTVNAGVLVIDGVNGGGLQNTTRVDVNGGTFLMRNGAQLTKANFTASLDDVTAGVVISANTGGHVDLTQSFNLPGMYQPPIGLTLSGDGGTVHGPVQLGHGTINPGNGGLGRIGTLTFSELHVGNGGTVVFDLSNVGTTDLITTPGTLEIGDGTLVANFTSPVAAGSSFRLMNAGNLISTSTFSGAIINARGAGGGPMAGWTLLTTPGAGGAVDLSINENSSSHLLQWQPGNPGTPPPFVANTWDTNVSANWKNLTDLARTVDFFYPTDAVTFPSTQSGTVVLVAPVFPGSVAVDAPAGSGYTFAGTTFGGSTFAGEVPRFTQTAGRISGSTGLLKVGAGNLVLLTDSDYAGSTTISAGTLQVGDNPLAGSSAASFNRYNSALSGSLGSGSVTIASGATLVFARRDAYIVPNFISGSGTLVKVNDSQIRLDAPNGYLGGTTINGGEIRQGSNNAIPINSTLTIGAMTNPKSTTSQIYGQLNLFGYNLTLGTLLSTAGSFGTITNSGNTALTATPTLTIASASYGGGINGNLNLVKTGSGVATMSYSRVSGSVPASTYTGKTQINGGTFQVLATSNPISHQGNGNSTYTVASGAALAGTGTIVAPITISSGGILAPGVFGGTTTTQVGTLALATLSLNSSIVNLDVNASAMDRIILTDTNGANTNGFSLLSGVSTINLANIGASFIATGSYPVIDYAGTPLADLSHFVLGTVANIGAPYQVSLVNDQTNTSINLKISNLVNATWAIATGGSWEVPSNWTSTPSGQYPDGTDSQATFGNIIGQPANVSITAPRTLGGMTLDSAQPYSITSSNSSATLIFDASAGAATAMVASGSHTIAVPVVAQDALLIDVAANSRLTLSKAFTVGDGVSGKSLTKSGLGTLQVEHVRTTVGNDGISTLTVSAGRLVVSQKTAGSNDPSGTSRVNSLSIGAGAVLDLTNNSMVIDYNTGAGIGSLLDDLRQMLGDGRLVTTAATPIPGRDIRLGYRDNANTAGAGNATVSDFGGQSVDASTVLIKFTYGGDTNLDGKVDVSDLLNLATHFNQSGVWQDGDFDRSGAVNSLDLAILAQDWQAGVGDGATLGGSLDALVAALPGLNVPEPAAPALIGFGLSCLARRRRNRPSRHF